MIRGTTAQFKFNLPYKFSQIQSVKITFWQPGQNDEDGNPLRIVKTRINCSKGSSENEVCTTLLPAETMKFSEELRGYVQFKGSTPDGGIFASKQESFIVYPICDSDTDFGEGQPPTDTEGEDWTFINAGEIGDIL